MENIRWPPRCRGTTHKETTQPTQLGRLGYETHCIAERQRNNRIHLNGGFTADHHTGDRAAFLRSVRLHPDAYKSRDYHTGLFDSSTDNCRGETLSVGPKSSLNDGNSAVSECHILFVDPEGEYIRIFNKSCFEWELGCHMIIQILGRGSIVLRYRLPCRFSVPPLGCVTLWRQLSPCRKAQIGSDLVCHGVVGWWVRSNCTTTLCRPDGQAIAWSTTARLALPEDECCTRTGGEDGFPVFCGLPEVPDPDEFWSDNLRNSIEVRRPSHEEQRRMFPCRYQRFQYQAPRDCCLPRMACPRQERTRPIPEICFAGAPAQRMGSCRLRKFYSSPAT